MQQCHRNFLTKFYKAFQSPKETICDSTVQLNLNLKDNYAILNEQLTSYPM